MTKTYFITATGTGIGKTFITCNLAKKLVAKKARFTAIKPVISGVDDSNINESDTGLILKSQNLPITQQNIEKISPWRFRAPLSPDIAAEKEGKSIDFAKVVQFCQNAADAQDYLLIEGAGGVMSPIASLKTNADLIAALAVPVILVAGNYLGTISHSLTAIKTLESYGIEIKYLLVNESADCSGADDIINSLRNFTDIPIVFVPHNGDADINL